MSASTAAFFILAYAFSWCAFIPLALNAQGVISGVPTWLHYAGAFGPLLAAFIVTTITSGSAGLHELLRRMTRWRIGLTWWAVALASPVVIFLAGALLVGLVSGDWPALDQFGDHAEFPQLGWLAGWLVWVLTFGLGEETGWRGFALPRLQKRYSARSVALIVGFLWAGWHIPTFFYNYEASLLSVLVFLVGILSGSAFLTFLYNSTGGSILAAIIWHGTYNATSAGAQPEISAMVTASIILAVILIARRYGPETFSPEEKQTL